MLCIFLKLAHHLHHCTAFIQIMWLSNNQDEQFLLFFHPFLCVENVSAYPTCLFFPLQAKLILGQNSIKVSLFQAFIFFVICK